MNHKNVSWMFGTYRKHRPKCPCLASLGFTECYQTVIQMDGVFYTHWTPILYLFSCVPFNFLCFLIFCIDCKHSTTLDTFVHMMLTSVILKVDAICHAAWRRLRNGVTCSPIQHTHRATTWFKGNIYSWLSLSRPRLSRITAYLEVKNLVPVFPWKSNKR